MTAAAAAAAAVVVVVVVVVVVAVVVVVVVVFGLRAGGSTRQTPRGLDRDRAAGTWWFL